MKFCFILDPLEGLKAYKDSSVAMMRCAPRRGHEVFAIQREALTWRDGAVCARARRLEVGACDTPNDQSPWVTSRGTRSLRTRRSRSPPSTRC
jgi:glutathione synthase/RimK-type ligase-like ATP-grasp enzyme